VSPSLRGALALLAELTRPAAKGGPGRFPNAAFG